MPESRALMYNREFFAAFATQYYAAGRLAFKVVGFDVVGHLFNRAIEYALKAALVQRHDLKTLKRLSHGLTDLQELLLQDLPELEASVPRSFIHSLDRWEKLRYPNPKEQMSRTMALSPYPYPAEWEIEWSSPGNRPLYRVVLQEVDVAFAALFEAASLNLPDYFHSLSPEAKAAVLRFNTVPSLTAAVATGQ